MNNQLEQFCVLLLFGILYYFLYRKNGRFQSNRIYLISALLLSIAIPMVSFEVFPNEVILKEMSSGSVVPVEKQDVVESSEKSIPYWTILYFIGAGVSFVSFSFQIFKIIIKIRSNDFEKRNKYSYSISNQHTTSSFFNYIFLEKEDEVLARHEESHAQLRHSIDRILMAVFQIIFWFNPMTYLFRYWMIENHEFQADQNTLKKINLKKSDYGQFLIGHKEISFPPISISNKFHSLIKNRIRMLSKKSKGNPFTYLLAIAFTLIAGSAFTLDSYTIYLQENDGFIQDTIPNPITNRYYEADQRKIVLVPRRNDPLIFVDLLERIDTLVIFDPTNYKETVIIDRVIYPEITPGKTEIPASEIESTQMKATFKETISIETSSASPNIKVKVEFTHGDFFAEMYDSGNRKIAEMKVKEGMETYQFPSDLELKPGKYYIRRSDRGQEVVVVLN